jgi:hypothetical protein
MNYRHVILGIVICSLAGCTWVSLAPKAEQVKVLSTTEVASCTQIGVTTVSLVDRIIGIRRDRKKVAAELRILGRNSASEMGGNAIMPASPVKHGEQTFTVYRCEDR